LPATSTAFACSSTSSALAVLDIAARHAKQGAHISAIGLSAAEENALIAFMTTLSDGYIKK
jgi:hypothetical protein